MIDPAPTRTLRLGSALLLLGAGLALLVHAGATQGLDEQVTGGTGRAVRSSAALLPAARVATVLGEPAIMTAGAVVLTVALWVTGHRRLALVAAGSRIGALVLSQGLKHLLDRPRPLLEPVVATATGAAYPSGHALGSAAFYATAAVLFAGRGWLRRTALVVPLLVATSRVLLGVHWLTDVIGGLLLGWGLALVLGTVATAATGARPDP